MYEDSYCYERMANFRDATIKAFLSPANKDLVSNLSSVDYVVLFKEDNPIKLITKIKPDIYVKGGDYEIDALAETALVKSWGGKAYAIPFIHDRSTTALLRKIRS